MKIVTLQRKGFLDSTDDDGYIIPPVTTETDPDFLELWGKCYPWMDNQYKQRVKLPLDRQTIWVFYGTTFEYSTDYPEAHEYLLYVFDVPMSTLKTDFLWSSYILWHDHLNDLESNKTNYDLFNINIRKPIYMYDKKSYTDIAQGITTRLNIKYLKKIVDIIPK